MDGETQSDRDIAEIIRDLLATDGESLKQLGPEAQAVVEFLREFQQEHAQAVRMNER